MLRLLLQAINKAVIVNPADAAKQYPAIHLHNLAGRPTDSIRIVGIGTGNIEKNNNRPGDRVLSVLSCRVATVG
jgi:hypothetical protein